MSTKEQFILGIPYYTYEEIVLPSLKLVTSVLPTWEVKY